MIKPCLTNKKNNALLTSYALASLMPLDPSLPISSPPPTLSPRGHGQPPLLYYLLLSAFLCLRYPLNSPPHALNKLYSIQKERKEGRKEGRKEERREGGEGGKKEGRKEGREGGREGGRERGREGGREGGRKKTMVPFSICMIVS
jgi:flagellar biosynthesis/type III secretory pathway protein FliH